MSPLKLGPWSIWNGLQIFEKSWEYAEPSASSHDLSTSRKHARSYNGSFQTPQSCQFLNRPLFRFSPMDMSLGYWLKEHYLKYKLQKWDCCEEFHGVTLRDKALGCEIRKVLNVKSHLRIGFSYDDSPTWLRDQNTPRKDLHGGSCWPHPRERDSEVVQRPGGVTTSPTLLGHVMVWSQQNYLRLL